MNRLKDAKITRRLFCFVLFCPGLASKRFVTVPPQPPKDLVTAMYVRKNSILDSPVLRQKTVIKTLI